MLTLGQMRRLLAGRGIRLTRSLGQSFLHDRNQLRRIVDAGGLTTQDRVLEIGPGLGPLTELLVARAGHVLAIEKDQRLVGVLRERLEQGEFLEVLHGDALEHVRRPGRSWRGWKVVANLPYAVASPMLVELALREDGPERMVVTVQWEVAKRLAAEVGTREYGLLTLLTRAWYEVTGWFKVPAGCFFPVPAVDSACVSLVRREASLVPGPALVLYERLVKRAFSQRRKMMLKLLKSEWPLVPWDEALSGAGLDRCVRAESVTPEQFAALTGKLRLAMEVAL